MLSTTLLYTYPSTNDKCAITCFQLCYSNPLTFMLFLQFLILIYDKIKLMLLSNVYFMEEKSGMVYKQKGANLLYGL